MASPLRQLVNVDPLPDRLTQLPQLEQLRELVQRCKNMSMSIMDAPLGPRTEETCPRHACPGLGQKRGPRLVLLFLETFLGRGVADQRLSSDLDFGSIRLGRGRLRPPEYLPQTIPTSYVDDERTGTGML